jgi:dTDP-4-amino-4,6-dideoxygalactose transaminase|tara:strand:- start:2217 stop:2807 length:591 start_codon:yes stop_codon:yes gene_type:complete
MSFKEIKDFENKIAHWFGSPYAVAIDCCTHAIELCLRYKEVDKFTVPPNTYPSIPNLAKKIGIEFEWKEEDWKDYYYLGGTNIIDAAVLWKRHSYIPGTLMCLSFQFQKHLNLGRGGMVLLDDKETKDELKKMSYDGRDPDVPWRDQNISTIGYHYYMTPETATEGLRKLPKAIETEPKKWDVSEWPDLRNMEIFK